jgi:hypothetical protein
MKARPHLGDVVGFLGGDVGQWSGINLREIVQRSDGVGILPVSRIHGTFLLWSVTGDRSIEGQYVAAQANRRSPLYEQGGTVCRLLSDASVGALRPYM